MVRLALAYAAAAGAEGPRNELTASELRVLRYLPSNLSRVDISRELFLSVNTVNTHIRNIYSKLGATRRTEAVEQARQRRLFAHSISTMRSHQSRAEDSAVADHEPKVYSIRIRGHLGAATLAAFPEMVSHQRGSDCMLTGVLSDHSALYGILAQIEVLGLELVEIRQLVPELESPETGEAGSP